MKSLNLFTSKREQHLWTWALVVVIAIYASIPFAGSLLSLISEEYQKWITAAFLPLFIAIIVTGIWLKWKKPSRIEVAVAAVIAIVYAMVLVRMTVIPAERTHLFEYGVVAILVYQALLERKHNGHQIPVPTVLAIVITALLGLLDESIQAFLPNRVYDIRDVGFNAFAGFMVITASLALDWARRGKNKFSKKNKNLSAKE